MGGMSRTREQEEFVKHMLKKAAVSEQQAKPHEPMSKETSNEVEDITKQLTANFADRKKR